MSFEELKEHNIFLPEEEWGELDLHTAVSLPALVTTFVVGSASCLLMATGGGGVLTWIGAALFIVFMLSFAVVSNRGIDRQNRRVEELHAEQNPPAADPL